MSEVIVIGLGHKARQGKDYIAEHIAKLELPDIQRSYVFHFADAIKEEITNSKREQPLIKKLDRYGKTYYVLSDNSPNAITPVHLYKPEQVPMLHKLFEKRGIEEYWGMDNKDSEMLQFWGTDFRRKFCGNNYWVEILEQKIVELARGKENCLILIPDVRFNNELEMILRHNGLYVEVQRYNEDKTRYLAKDRDPQHVSEMELDKAPADYYIMCLSGDLTALKMRSENVIKRILEKRAVK